MARSSGPSDWTSTAKRRTYEGHRHRFGVAVRYPNEYRGQSQGQPPDQHPGGETSGSHPTLLTVDATRWRNPRAVAGEPGPDAASPDAMTPCCPRIFPDEKKNSRKSGRPGDREAVQAVERMHAEDGDAAAEARDRALKRLNELFPNAYNDPGDGRLCRLLPPHQRELLTHGFRNSATGQIARLLIWPPAFLRAGATLRGVAANACSVGTIARAGRAGAITTGSSPKPESCPSWNKPHRSA
jgi:hypothetical protein